MKKDPADSISEIRKLCNEALSDPDNYYAKNPLALLARIEWICRHTEEDYDEKGKIETLL